jgi:hypothetical protein
LEDEQVSDADRCEDLAIIIDNDSVSGVTAEKAFILNDSL